MSGEMIADSATWAEKKELAELVETAKHDRNPMRRIEAVLRLSDEAVLADIVESGWFDDVRVKALKQISSQPILANLVKNAVRVEGGFVGDFYRLIFEKLTDQVLLTDIAQHASDSIARENAADNLTDQKTAQEVYADIAQNDEGEYSCLFAAEKLADLSLAQEVYASIIKNSTDSYALERALKKLTDQTLLREIAQSEDTKYVFERKGGFSTDDYATLFTEDLRDLARKRLAELT